MKYLTLILALLVSSLHAGDMFKLDRETAKQLVVEAAKYKREVLLTNRLEGLYVTEKSTYIDLTELPQYYFILDYLEIGKSYPQAEYKAVAQEAFLEMGVFFETGETFLEVSLTETTEELAGNHLSHINFLVDTIAIIETYRKFFEEKGIDRDEQERAQSMCNGVCWGQNILCKTWSGLKLSNCIGFCQNHPAPPPNCFDTCTLERNFRDLECDIDYLICLDNCGGGC
jgi:hypothetical protein